MRRRLLGIGVALSGLFNPALAQTTAPVTANAAPAAWVQYAKLAQKEFEGTLGDDSPPAQRLRTYLGSGANPPTGTIPVNVWVDLQGKVTRVTFPPFLDTQANADLTDLLQGGRLAQSPPKNMLLPMRLTLQVAPTPVAHAMSPASGSAPPPQH